MKALKINVTTQKIEEVEIGDYKDIYKEIQCNLFCCPIEFENGDVLYADDESLLQDELPGCFTLNFFSYLIVGNAIILGTDDEGESIDAKTTKEDLITKYGLRFGGPELSEMHRDNLSGPTIIGF